MRVISGGNGGGGMQGVSAAGSSEKRGFGSGKAQRNATIGIVIQVNDSLAVAVAQTARVAAHNVGCVKPGGNGETAGEGVRQVGRGVALSASADAGVAKKLERLASRYGIRCGDRRGRAPTGTAIKQVVEARSVGPKIIRVIKRVMRDQGVSERVAIVRAR